MKYKIKKLPINFEGKNLQLSYANWGEENGKKLICVHGLTRNCRDFDYIAERLSAHYHVICPDIPGRGTSSWLEDYTLYNYKTYINCLYQLIDFYNIQQTDWLGSSMGGLLGMHLAARNPSLIRNLILNDIGPYVPYKSLSKIASYVDKYPLFISLDEAEQYLRKIIPNFGIKTEQDWKYITQNSFIKGENGLYYQAYDPKLVQAFVETHGNDVDLWNIWENIQSKILVIRGEKSNILLKETANAMQNSKILTLYELKDIGHTPSLMNGNEINLIENWLLLNNL